MVKSTKHNYYFESSARYSRTRFKKTVKTKPRAHWARKEYLKSPTRLELKLKMSKRARNLKKIGARSNPTRGHFSGNPLQRPWHVLLEIGEKFSREPKRRRFDPPRIDFQRRMTSSSQDGARKTRLINLSRKTHCGIFLWNVLRTNFWKNEP